jgi:hypothetical protein
MKTTHLQHHRRLGYASASNLRTLPADIESTHPCTQLISFRKLDGVSPDRTIKKVHAAIRPMRIYSGESICFYGVQSDSPLAPLLLWDAAHFMEVGQKITIVEDSPMGFYLDRDYFSTGLKLLTSTQNKAVFEKVAKLPAETDDDLDNWTFGIPVGPEDATVLNAIVKRILEIDIPNKDIVLCGKPGANFAYFDQVRIIGEDITAPPVQICKKKNRIAQEAKYNNLVILHDRVFLPKHFGEMVRRFGPRYPFMTLQCMYFDNCLSMNPRRYSDYGMAMSEIGQGLKGLHRRSGEATSIAPSIFTEVERTGFCFASPMRYNKDSSYPTGSMYICRKEVWNSNPLDESLLWVEFEDVEQGIRLSKSGVPSRVNPYGISQTVTTRALLGVPSPAESMSGKLVKTGPSYMSLVPKKPLFKVSTEAALAKLRQFSEKYHDNPDCTAIPTGLSKIKARAWVTLVNRVVQQASFQNNAAAVREFISDFEKMVLLDQMPCGQQESLYMAFMEDAAAAKKSMVANSFEIRNMLYQRPRASWFYSHLTEFFHSRLAIPGILLSATCAYLNNGKLFYFESLPAAIKAVYNSTPFKTNAKGAK